MDACLKDVKNKHGWFIYFRQKHNTLHIKFKESRTKKEKTSPTHLARPISTFDRSSAIVEELLSWLTWSGDGGCKGLRPRQHYAAKFPAEKRTFQKSKRKWINIKTQILPA